MKRKQVVYEISEQIPFVEEWLEQHGIGGLEVTNVKDFSMVELWDDRCRQVITNQGKVISEGICTMT